LYSPNNLLLKFLSVPQIAFALNVEPETRRLPKIPGKAQRGIQSDCALAVNNFVDRRAGTSKARASAFCDKPIGFM